MLIGAGMRAGGGPLRYLAAPTAHVVERNTWAQAGPQRNWWAGQATVINGASIANKSSIPDGLRHPGSWCIAPKAGGMSSRFSAGPTIGATGVLVGGVTSPGTAGFSISFANATAFPLDDTSPLRTGTASLSINFANATGQLIVSGSGTASMSFSLPSAPLISPLAGAGSASLSIATNAPILGAIASLTASASFAFTTTAGILPADDTSPARTASASFSFSGTLAPYAVGNMVGSTEDTTVLTADGIADAVWSKVLP